MHQKKSFFFSLLVYLYSSGIAFPETVQQPPWIILETKHTILRFLKAEDLDALNSSIDFKKTSWGFRQLFSEKTPDSIHGEIILKIDSLYARVQEILDMRKKSLKVFINLYSNREDLDQVYYRLYQSKNNIRAWYVFDHNTIYINADDVHEGILAHEMAHAIIDHFLLVRPPAASAEILARYVDAHIHK
ncbi:MAG: hypothetical protein ABIK15_14100 [Pseudomonadota bacterium]